MNENTTEQEPVASSNGSGAEKGNPTAELEAQLKEQTNKYLYLYADFENYKKRALKERSELLRYGHEHFAKELLQVADNLKRALSHGEAENSGTLMDGLKMVETQLKETLSRFGVVEMNATGSKFDPQLHEAVGQEEGPAAEGGKTEPGTVIREIQKGYFIHGRLLRAARVIIAK